MWDSAHFRGNQGQGLTSQRSSGSSQRSWRGKYPAKCGPASRSSAHRATGTASGKGEPHACGAPTRLLRSTRVPSIKSIYGHFEYSKNADLFGPEGDPAVALRYSLTYGPRQRSERLLG